MWYNKFGSTIQFLVAVAVISLVFMIWILLGSAPGGSNTVLFYLALSGLLLSTLALVNYSIRRLFGQRELQQQYFSSALRQSLWLTLIVDISLLLSSHGMFSWINAIFLLFVFVFLESYLLTTNKHLNN